MNTPINANTPTQVELLCLTDDGPMMFEGRARYGSNETEIEVDVSGPVQGRLVGSQAILTFPDQDAPRMTARVFQAEGNRLMLATPRMRPRDKRLYPRLYGNIPLRYQVHSPDDGDLAVHRWLAGSSQDLGPRPWRSPEPFMNFSVSGLSFEDEEPCQENDLLLLHLGVGDDPRRWRATGRVVRVTSVPPEEEGEAPLHQIALSFEAISDDAIEALSEFTLTIQEALL